MLFIYFFYSLEEIKKNLLKNTNYLNSLGYLQFFKNIVYIEYNFNIMKNFITGGIETLFKKRREKRLLWEKGVRERMNKRIKEMDAYGKTFTKEESIIEGQQLKNQLIRSGVL